MAPYGELKCNSLIYETGSGDVTVNVSTIPPGNDPVFTGDVTLTGSSYNVVFDASDNALEFANNAKAIFGTGSDLQLYADGNHSFLDHNGNGSFYIRTLGTSESIYVQGSGNAIVKTGASAKTSINCVGDGQVELYNNDVKTFETIGNGILVQGTEGANGSIYLYADEGDDNGDKWQFQAATDGGYKIKSSQEGVGQQYLL